MEEKDLLWTAPKAEKGSLDWTKKIQGQYKEELFELFQPFQDRTDNSLSIARNI